MDGGELAICYVRSGVGGRMHIVVVEEINGLLGALFSNVLALIFLSAVVGSECKYQYGDEYASQYAYG